ncbi:hypothetical protein F6455_12085 [Proteobacteria bacterium 005FR1]|nr:hypothetical protein [Proteobacteria bacterium 005FR1]
MDKIIFSQSGVYRLQQLASQVRNITGIRHRLSDESAMLELLRCCASSNHKVIKTYFAAFTSELDERQRISLQARGVRAHQGEHPQPQAC